MITDDLRTRASAPGQLTWKFDGGRGAMIDEDGVIVGYFTGIAARCYLQGKEDAAQELHEEMEQLRERNKNQERMIWDLEELMGL